MAEILKPYGIKDLQNPIVWTKIIDQLFEDEFHLGYKPINSIEETKTKFQSIVVTKSKYDLKKFLFELDYVRLDKSILKDKIDKLNMDADKTL